MDSLREGAYSYVSISSNGKGEWSDDVFQSSALLGFSLRWELGRTDKDEAGLPVQLMTGRQLVYDV